MGLLTWWSEVWQEIEPIEKGSVGTNGLGGWILKGSYWKLEGIWLEFELKLKKKKKNNEKWRGKKGLSGFKSF